MVVASGMVSILFRYQLLLSIRPHGLVCSPLPQVAPKCGLEMASRQAQNAAGEG